MEYGWGQFEKTGKVEDYLNYCVHRQEMQSAWKEKEAGRNENEYGCDWHGTASYADRRT